MVKETTFKSGAKRSEKHPNTNRIPLGFLKLIARRGDYGEGKYGRFNYRWGFQDGEFVEQFFVHAVDHLQNLANEYHNIGKFPTQLDDDLEGAAWGVMALWEAREAQRATTTQTRSRREVRSDGRNRKR